jgi:hypothetical protein
VKKVLPPTYFLAVIVLMGAFHFVLSLRQVIPFPWCLLGVMPLLLGVFLNLLADHVFKRYHTTVKPFMRSSALVTGSVVNCLAACYEVLHYGNPKNREGLL